MRNSPTVADVGEHAIVERIRERVPAPGPGLRIGIGDDAAVVEPDRGALSVLTTDTLVEGVHFDRAHGSPADVGGKALAVNLSDLAAMGAAPRYALLTLSLPAGWLAADVDELLDGFLAQAARHRTTLAGGDVTASPGPAVIGVTAIGSAKPRRVLGRGAPFDAIVCSAAPAAIPPALIEQLAPAGRLILPLGTQRQHLVLVERNATGLSQRKLLPVRFVPMQ